MIYSLMVWINNGLVSEGNTVLTALHVPYLVTKDAKLAHTTALELQEEKKEDLKFHSIFIIRIEEDEKNKDIFLREHTSLHDPLCPEVFIIHRVGKPENDKWHAPFIKEDFRKLVEG